MVTANSIDILLARVRRNRIERKMRQHAIEDGFLWREDPLDDDERKGTAKVDDVITSSPLTLADDNYGHYPTAPSNTFVDAGTIDRTIEVLQKVQSKREERRKSLNQFRHSHMT